MSGFYLYKYRHYSAELGRWLGRDPIEEDGGINLYAFVGNDPIGKWDELGLVPCTDCDGNLDNSTDCEWTDVLIADRFTNGDLRTLSNHQLGNPIHARVWWDNICSEGRILNLGKLVTNPSGAKNLDLIGNSARSSLQSRYYWKEAALAPAFPYSVVNNLVLIRSGKGRAGSSAKFCCCKPMD